MEGTKVDSTLNLQKTSNSTQIHECFLKLKKFCRLYSAKIKPADIFSFSLLSVALFDFANSVLEYYMCLGASLVTQRVKNLPAVWETWVQPLGWEAPVEKGTLPNPVF